MLVVEFQIETAKVMIFFFQSSSRDKVWIVVVCLKVEKVASRKVVHLFLLGKEAISKTANVFNQHPIDIIS